MKEKCLKFVWMSCDLKARAERLARLNNMTCSELVRLSIETKLPNYEAGRQPLKSIEMQDSVSKKPSQVIQNEI